ncbi:MAG: ABC transporter permease [Bdellovibrionales bacterium]
MARGKGILTNFRFAPITGQMSASFEKNFYRFLKHWFSNSFEVIIQPLLFFLCFGFGLQKWIGEVSGLDYPLFLFYGILCATAMSTSLNESALGLFDKYISNRQYLILATCPTSNSDLLVGEFLWSVFKSMLAVSILLLIGTSMELVPVTEFLQILMCCLWISIFFSSLGLLIGMLIDSRRKLNQLVNLISIPLFLFSGVFFPVERLPELLQTLVYLFPITSAIDWLRDNRFQFGTDIIARVTLFLLLSFIFLNFSYTKFRYKMHRLLERGH